MLRRAGVILLAVVVAGLAFVFSVVPSSSADEPDADEVVLVEPSGRWHIRVPGQADYTFWYGMSGDMPLLGDWDRDGWDTPGMYRPSTGFVYLTNILPPDGGVGSGDPALTFFFGNPGDQVVVGDWNGDGVDTLGIRRNARMFLTNVNATSFADWDFWFGNPEDSSFGGDTNGNGFDSIILYRPSSAFVYYTDAVPGGSGLRARTSGDFYFGLPSDRHVVGDWDGDGTDTAGIFRPSDRMIYLRDTLDTGPADTSYGWGQPSWMPVAGHVGTD